MYAGTCATIWLEYLRSHSVKRQPVMRIASAYGQACAQLGKATVPRVARTDTDERTHRDTAGILHGRTT